MPIPDYQSLMLPLLRVLSDGTERARSTAIEAVCRDLELTQEERELQLASGRGTIIANRTRRAFIRLANAGLVTRARRGVWQITAQGAEVLATRPQRLSNDDLKRFPGFSEFLERRRVPDSEAGSPDRSLDRDSVDAARAVLESLYVDDAIRAACLTRLADAAVLAEQLRPGSWSITLKRHLIRLNAGRFAVVSLRPEAISVLIDENLVSATAGSALADLGEMERWPNPSISGGAWFTAPAQSWSSAEALVRDANRSAIEQAVAQASSPYKAAHSPGVTELLREEVGVQLIDPTHGGEESDIPASDELLRPLLEALAGGESRLLTDIVRDVAERLELEGDVQALRPRSGRTRLENRLGRARTSLIKAGLVDQPAPNRTVITLAGRALLASYDGVIDEDYLAENYIGFANWLADMGGDLPDEERSDSEPTVWMVRAGEAGRLAVTFVSEKQVQLGWDGTGDITGMSRDEVIDSVNAWMPTSRKIIRGQAANALFRLANGMRMGDLVITPEPATRTVLFGWIDGPYQYRPDPIVGEYRHVRPVRWFARVSRDELSYGAQNSIGTAMTLTRPAHVQELLRLATLHADDQEPNPVEHKARRLATDRLPERVVIPLGASVSPRTILRDFQTVPRRLMQLVDELGAGEVALPDFQRTFVWEPEATRELIVSMIRSFPAGALLFLQGGSATFKARSVEGAPPLSGQPSYLVLDGQQRLTSLYQAISGVGDSRFFLDIGALVTGSDVNQAVRMLSASRAKAFESLRTQALTLMMPLATLRERSGPSRWRDEVVAEREGDDRERARGLLRDLEGAFIDPLLQYSFPVTILPDSTPLEAVCTIFETLNRTGKPLTTFELISARAFAGGHSLYDFWNAALERYPILADFDVQPYYLLQTIALGQGLSCKKSVVLSLTPDDIAANWSDAVSNMSAALTLLRDECGVLVAKWLPYQPMIIPLAGAWRDVARTTGPAEAGMRAKLKRWYWCACFSGEYESSSVSLAERDTPVLRSWLAGGPEPSVVADFAWDRQRWRSVTSRQQGLYKATIALSLLDHPIDFHTGAPLTQDVIAAGRVDDHHIFPRGYLDDSGRHEEVDSVLNHTLIDRATNIRIGKKAPSEYLREIRTTIGGTLDRVLASHGLPVGDQTPLTTNDFDAFLAWRIDRFWKMLRDHVGAISPSYPDADGSRADVSGQIVAIERTLRELIADALGGQVDALPAHVQEKAKERMAAALRRNPSRAGERYEMLESHLEYCDLRELQDTITTKTLWVDFEPVFGTKEALNMRFAQLAELRNTLAHTRPMDEITRKDGEAALLWFQQVLAYALRS